MRKFCQIFQKSRFKLAALSLLLPAFSAFGQTPEKPPKLAFGQPIERAIKGGETHSFEFDVKAGFYARAEVEQKNIDVIAALLVPHGNRICNGR